MIEPSFIRCPHCQGLSYAFTPGGQVVRCPHCRAETASLMLYDDDIVLWKKQYDDIWLRQQRRRRWLARSCDIISLVLAIAGIISLVNILRPFTFSTESYLGLLTNQSLDRFIFWLSLATNLWWYARVAQWLQRQQQPIRRLRNLRSIQSTAITDWETWQRLIPKLGIDASHYLIAEAENNIEKAARLARRRGQLILTPAALLLYLLDTSVGKTAMVRLQLDSDKIKAGCNRVAAYEQKHPISQVAVAMLLAYSEARRSQRPRIGLLELLIGCVQADERLRTIFDDQSVTLKEIQHAVHWGNVVTDLLKRERRRRQLARFKPKTTMNRAMTARPTKVLDSVSQDFTLLARRNHFLPAVGRGEEVAEAFRVLQEGASSVLLVGEPGVGKSTILEGIAELMTAEDVPATLQDKRLVVTDPGSLIAGAGDVGGLEGRMQTVIYEIIQAGNVIWCIEDIHTLLGAGSTRSSIDIGKEMMNYISQGYLKVIGTSTTKEYEKYIEPQEAFARRFQIVRVPELKTDDAILVLEGRAPFLEAKYHVFFTYQALTEAVRLTERYQKDRHLPAKAIDVMEEAAILAREQAGSKTTLVTKDQVAQVMAQKTNVALTSITASESQKLLALEDILHQRVIGQDEAITAIAKALRRAREDVRDLSRPIATLLFLGPTGVGKTETAKAIAASYFGNEQAMLRFDMSEYQTVESISKLIGAPGQPGLLTEAIRQKPFSIVLLDELEKAHHDLLNVFLQVMEDGRLTDGSGYTADFTNAMLIATSNAATSEIQRCYTAKQSAEEIAAAVLEGDLLEQWFSPEFLNRFDHIAIFTPFEPAELIQIAELLLRRLAEQLLEKGIQLRWTDAAVVELVKKGYHPQFGARPLRRVIQDQVQDALAQLLLRAKLSRRDVVELQAGGTLRVIKAEPV